MINKDADQIAAADDVASSEAIETRTHQASDDGRDDPQITDINAAPPPDQFAPAKSTMLDPLLGTIYPSHDIQGPLKKWQKSAIFFSVLSCAV